MNSEIAGPPEKNRKWPNEMKKPNKDIVQLNLERERERKVWNSNFGRNSFGVQIYRGIMDLRVLTRQKPFVGEARPKSGALLEVVGLRSRINGAAGRQRRSNAGEDRLNKRADRRQTERFIAENYLLNLGEQNKECQLSLAKTNKLEGRYEIKLIKSL